MSNYRRVRIAGGTYFFTLVTRHRHPYFDDPVAQAYLREAINKTRLEYPFSIKAMVVMPDHLHCIWELPKGDDDYSNRWRIIKTRVTQRMKSEKVSASIWQNRFWEHTIRDEKDFEKHFDYIHFNPVKHGLVDRPWKWPLSTFHKYVAKRLYSENWGNVMPENLKDAEGFGE